MRLAEVSGKVWATKKVDGLTGQRFALVNILASDGTASGGTFVVVDHIGAGVGDKVLITAGGSARLAIGSMDVPIDAAIIAIVDSIEAE